MLIVVLVVMGFVFIDGNTKKENISDQMLFSNFKENKDNFNQMVNLVDSIGAGNRLDSLMSKANITHINNFERTIEFVYYSSGGVATSLDINYIYLKNADYMTDILRSKDIINCDTISKDLNDIRLDIGDNCHLIKRINDRWYIDLLYDW